MLERFVLGELGAEDTRRLTAALATSPELQARLDALALDSRATLAQHPPELVARVVARRLAGQPPASRSPLRVLVPALAGLAAVLWLVLPAQPAGDAITLKGEGPALRLYRLGDAGPERLPEGAPAHAHDVVQVAFDLAALRYLVVVSVDGSGGATLHWPLDGDTRVPEGLKTIPRSFELDDAPGFERFFLVAGNQPLPVDVILGAARELARGAAPRTASLPVPTGATVRAVRLDKVRP
jgi:hypothetical protein